MDHVVVALERHGVVQGLLGRGVCLRNMGHIRTALGLLAAVTAATPE